MGSVSLNIMPLGIINLKVLKTVLKMSDKYVNAWCLSKSDLGQTFMLFIQTILSNAKLLCKY